MNGLKNLAGHIELVLFSEPKNVATGNTENRKGLGQNGGSPCFLFIKWRAKLLGDRAPGINKYELKQCFTCLVIQSHPVLQHSLFHLNLDFPQCGPRKNSPLRIQRSRKHCIREG